MNLKWIILVIVFYYLIFALYISLNTYINRGKARIYFFDIGQGDAALLVTETGKRVLIDGGPDNTITQEFLNLGLFPVCTIDIVIVTHPHADHLKGITNILKNCNVSALMFNDVDYPSKLYTDFLSNIKNNKNIKKIYSHVESGDNFEIDGISFYVLWPNDLTLKSFNDLNQTSIVVLIDAGNTEILMTGDAEAVSLSQIDLDFIAPLIDGNLDILKVPHHGSSAGFSPYIFDKLPPTYCLISLGVNSYGHPNSATVESMGTAGCKVMRTDEKGTIEFGLN